MNTKPAGSEERDYTAYQGWATQYPLLNAADELEWLKKHEALYFELVKHVHIGRQLWFAERYPELDLTGEDWLEVLWGKRPFMKDILQAARESQEHNPDIRRCLSQLNKVREHLLASNIRLVMKVAHKHFDEALSFYDLVQEGQFGLMRAMERFETARGLRFSTYATHWITQFIRLAIKKNSRVVRIPTNVQENMQRVKRTMAQSQQLGYGQSLPRSELAKRAEVDDQSVDSLLILMQSTSSLHERFFDDSDQLPIDMVEADVPNPEQQTEQTEASKHIDTILAGLPKRDQLILKMRYGIGMPQEYGYREIAEQLDLSRERVRQIESELVKKLRHVAL